jgi:CRISPR/Cas system-associated exonuclease Cas4 (RecB family)
MIKNLLDNFFIENERDLKPQEHFYVSDVGHCGRAIFFNFKGIPKKKLDPRMSRIFATGDTFHNNIFSLMYSILSIKIIGTEIRMPKNDLFSGRADAIVLIDKKLYLMDVKSMNSFIFKKMENAQPENIQQVQLYLHFFNIEKGILFYIDKDRQEIKEFIITYDPLQVHFLLQGFKKLKDMIDKGEVPPQLWDYPKGWQCNYCRYQEKCAELGTNKTL